MFIEKRWVIFFILVISLFAYYSFEGNAGAVSCECADNTYCELLYGLGSTCEVNSDCSSEPPENQGTCTDPNGGGPDPDQCECVSGTNRGIGWECGFGEYCEEGKGDCETQPLQDGMCSLCPNDPVCPGDEPDNLVCCADAGSIEFGECSRQGKILWRGQPYQWCLGSCEYAYTLEEACSGSTPFCYNGGCQSNPERHLTCNAAKQCVSVPGSGDDACSFNSDCYSCAISNVQITPNCGVDGCSAGETVTLTATYTGADCRTYGKHLQVNAVGGDCSVHYQGGDVSGVYNSANLLFTGTNSGAITGTWTVRSAIDTSCEGERVFATQAELWDGLPGQSSVMISQRTSASGDFTFSGTQTSSSCNDETGWVTRDIIHKGPSQMKCVDNLIGCVRSSDGDSLYDQYCDTDNTIAYIGISYTVGPQ